MTDKGIVSISGISESRAAPVAAYISHLKKGPTLIITQSHVRATRLSIDLSFFQDRPIYVMPQEEDMFFGYEAKNADPLIQRLNILKSLNCGEDCIVISPVLSVMKKMIPHDEFESKAFSVSLGDKWNLEEIKQRLSEMGYERRTLIDAKGQFAVRGDIVDIYTPDSEVPWRIEFFDTEIDAIRTFDLESQRSLENKDTLEIYPARQFIKSENIFSSACSKIEKEYDKNIKKAEKSGDEERKENLEKKKAYILEHIKNTGNMQMLENYLHYFYEETEYLWEYINDGQVIVDDPDRTCETLDLRTAELKDDFHTLLDKGQAVPNDYKIFAHKEDFFQVYKREDVYVFTPFAKQIKGAEKQQAVYSIKSSQPIAVNGRLEVLERELKAYLKKEYEVTIACSTKDRVENIREFLSRCSLEDRVTVKEGELTAGIDLPEYKKVWISDSDIFTGTRHRKRKNRKKRDEGSRIKTFADIKKGDYVVHENHGIGKFIAIKQLRVAGEKKDYLQIKYSGKDMLYVPVEQMDIVQKYTGGDGSAPKINSLSGGEWKKTKAKAKAAVANMAADLLEMSAARQLEKGYAFGTNAEWQQKFEDSFPFVETDDQMRCIEEIKEDMEKATAMDRLLCGDVGFGKTEVAARAMFKCIADGKQAAVLVPTTILANQHYYTLKDRFERFPFKVDVLSRFKSDKEQSKTIEKINEGRIDLVIGTHRLLSKDVGFKDLGLLVIDEEQRFGVAHKEAIKKLRKNVDVLTLSATPIPRTLHMSLTGIRDMSLIQEPPEERYPIQTYVTEQDDGIIKDIIERELGRGGQVYVVFNRVQGINQVATKIQEMVPEGAVTVAHGQMNESTLEKAMLKFVNGETNILVATTIIESGLDISNVNTIIILDADRFGLSQLYQLRGRVGRSDKMAYAYLMYQSGKMMTEVAEKRLRAIKEFTEFGSGFKVAMRDLEIRGAGNILGTEQHGHMMNIGYELYCKFVEDAVRALQGEIVNDSKEETLIELSVAAYIPDRYIEDETLKLHMYKKIADVLTEEDEEDITEELIDRFGDIPTQVTNLIKISRIRKLAAEEFISKISEEQGKIIFRFTERNRIKAEAIAKISEKYGLRVFFHSGVKPFIKFKPDKNKYLTEIIELLKFFK